MFVQDIDMDKYIRDSTMSKYIMRESKKYPKRKNLGFITDIIKNGSDDYNELNKIHPHDGTNKHKHNYNKDDSDIHKMDYANFCKYKQKKSIFSY